MLLPKFSATYCDFFLSIASEKNFTRKKLLLSCFTEESTEACKILVMTLDLNINLFCLIKMTIKDCL